MITLYYDKKNESCKQAIRWFEKYQIEIVQKKVETISRSELIFILTLTENGFHYILKHSTATSIYLHKIEAMSFNEGVDFILEHLYILKLPIIVGDNKLQAGYRLEDMRIFLSHRYQILERI